MREKMIGLRHTGAAFPPLGGTAALADASPEELRVLLCLIEKGGSMPLSEAQGVLSAAAGCTAARAGSALRYWVEVGILEESGEGEVAAPRPLSREPQPMPATEIAEVVEREGMQSFVDACQQLAGRVFNLRELEMLISLVEELPFSQEYWLMLAAYSKKKSGRVRFSLRYLAQVAYTMLERECLTPEQLSAFFEAEERFASEEWKIRRLLGIGERRLGPKEQAYFLRWTGEFGYGVDIIGIAYDITVDRTGKISLQYMNRLLEGFFAAGCRTEDEVQAHLEREREEHDAKRLTQRAARTGGKGKQAPQHATGKSESDPTATRGSSFRSGDYMSAALRRSYGDDGEE